MTCLMKTNLSKMKCINPKDIKLDKLEETINKVGDHHLSFKRK